MKKLAILFAIISLALNVAVAENVKPAVKANVKVEHNGYNLVTVEVGEVESETVRVKIYDKTFGLLHSEVVREESSIGFDISELNAGQYFLKVTAKGETVYAEAIEKIK